MLDSIVDVGLEDIENRNDKKHALPPEKFFNSANIEIAFSGISSYRTFDQHIEEIKRALDKGKRIYFFILNPNSTDIDSLNTKESRDIKGDIIQTLSTIKRENFVDKPGFNIKYVDKLPKFTAIMIDGDIDPIGISPQDSNGRIRVQPTSLIQTQHRGVIFQFKKKQNKSDGAFDFYATEFRNQWKNVCYEDQTIIQNL